MLTIRAHASIVLILKKDITEQGFARFTIVFGLCTSYTFLAGNFNAQGAGHSIAGIGQGVTEVQGQPVDFLMPPLWELVNSCLKIDWRKWMVVFSKFITTFFKGRKKVHK